jgi:hypothetical protein
MAGPVILSTGLLSSLVLTPSNVAVISISKSADPSKQRAESQRPDRIAEVAPYSGHELAKALRLETN